MLARVFSAFPYGIEGKLVEVEVEVESGLRSFTIVGLPDEAVKEAAKRVSLALANAGFVSPDHINKKVTVNLAPADSKKQGSYFDLAIAIGFLVASSQILPALPTDLFLGELSLEGNMRPVRGTLALALGAKRLGYTRVFLPYENNAETRWTNGIAVYPVRHLRDAVGLLRLSEAEFRAYRQEEPREEKATGKIVACDHCGSELPGAEGEGYDFSEIRGQQFAKRALEIAAAGGHHSLFVGPPGAGKSILAKAFPSILPSLSQEERMEIGTILSVMGLLEQKTGADIWRQFRSPHHSASASAILGGGNPVRPGEITLAHQGVLFLDEFPEFHRDVLEALRQPLEDKTIHVARSAGSFRFPANFQLVAAANPCPCGFKDDAAFPCTCTPGQLSRYQRKFSGPLIDRIDLWVSVPRLTKEEMLDKKRSGECSCVIRERVSRARDIQRARLSQTRSNSGMTLKEIGRFCALDEESEKLLGRAIERLALSPRSYHKILKVARTIADLAASESITTTHLAEALQYRRQTSV